MPDLHIPTAAIEAVLVVRDDWDYDIEVIEAARAIAAPTVAAEFRRLVRENADVRDLLARADELDPPRP